MKRIYRRLDEFEDDPIAPVVGALILMALTFALLLAPVAGGAVVQ